jgi:lipocalin-like protein
MIHIHVNEEERGMSILLRRLPLRLLRAGAAVGTCIVLVQMSARAQEGADANARIVGSWRVLTYELEFQDGGERVLPLGDRPNGYLVFGADGRMMAYLEAGGRKAPRTDEERAAAYRSMLAYTGKYRVEGGKWTTKVDGTWNVEWAGTDQERYFTLAGDRLTVTAQWNPNPLYNRRMTRGRLTFQREK